MSAAAFAPDRAPNAPEPDHAWAAMCIMGAMHFRFRS